MDFKDGLVGFLTEQEKKKSLSADKEQSQNIKINTCLERVLLHPRPCNFVW
jgi:hypothetical protein